MSYDELQQGDDTDTAVAAQNKVRQRIRERIRRENREIEAQVRRLVKEAEAAVAGETDELPQDILEDLHWFLWLDPSRETVLAPEFDDLDDHYKVQFKRMHRHRERGIAPDPEQEYAVLAEIARAQDYLSGITDPSSYAPVKLEVVNADDDEPDVTLVDEPTPIGRRRIGHADAAGPEDREVIIPHKDCDHILLVALPRQGKDSTMASIAKNLHAEHRYKFISVFDDGRMETPMTAIPQDESALVDILSHFQQSPDGFDAEVFVPAMGELPDALPANFTPFTIGLDSLTPNLILRIAGGRGDDTVEARIDQALTKTIENSGEVTELVGRLEHLSEETEATIEWTEEVETQNGGTDTETKTAHYSMPAEKALQKAAQRVAQLAGEGLLASPDAATNIDMVDVIRDDDQAAVLCCNFLPAGQEGLKYIITDLWLRLIYRARDENPRIPRVALGLRELKNLAPTNNVMGDRHRDAIKTLRNTIFFLTTQGGSRRILLIGSTQKLNDVQKPIRSNMATKILLRLGEEEIETLDRSYHFSNEQKEQLSGFQQGYGMVLGSGDAYWPVQFRPAPCGLGQGDQHWLDRYGKAWGARVRQQDGGNWKRNHSDEDWWVHVNDYVVYDLRDGDRPPRVGDFYSEWYLLESDFDEDVTPEDVDKALVEDVLRDRRRDGVKTDLSMQPTGYEDRQRSVHLDATDTDPGGLDELANEYEVPRQVRPILDVTPSKRQRVIQALTAIKENEISSYDALSDEIGVSTSTLSNYFGKDGDFTPCLERRGQYYALTAVGKRLVSIDWSELEAGL